MSGSDPTDLSGNYRLGLFSSMTLEDEPSKTKMTHVAKLFAGKIRMVEESDKFEVIQGRSASPRLSIGIDLFADDVLVRASATDIFRVHSGRMDPLRCERLRSDS